MPVSSPCWEEVIHVRKPNLQLPPLNFLKKQKSVEMGRYFGSLTPPAGDALLFCGKGWKIKVRERAPVLLVPGAGCDANTHYTSGLGFHLAEKGFPVFASTFSHAHGHIERLVHELDTVIQALQKITKKQEFHLIGHSLGGLVAYVWLLAQESKERGQAGAKVLNYVGLGVPYAGHDYLFRFPDLNLSFQDPVNPEFNWPMTCVELLQNTGEWKKTTHLSFLGEHYPAMCQISARFDKIYPLLWNDHELCLHYNGGKSKWFHSPGIDVTVANGGNFIEWLKKQPVPETLRLWTFAGNRPDRSDRLSLAPGITDGRVMKNSALGLKGNCVNAHLFETDHVGLAHNNTVMNAIDHVLSHGRL